MVVMNTSPRTGDAYLKHLGMVHDDSTRPELAPPYDIVTAGAWIPGDLQAIPFGSRSWLTPEERYGVWSHDLPSIAPGHKAHHAPLRGGHSGYAAFAKDHATGIPAGPGAPAPEAHFVQT